MAKKPFTLNATSLRIALLTGVALVLLLQIGLIALGQSIITSYSQKVASAVSVSSSDEKTLQDLETVNKLLKQQEEIVEKSRGITADKSNTYAYQNKIIQDIATYGERSGVSITGWSFSEPAGTPTTGAATGAATAAGAAAPANTGAPTGVTPVDVTINLGPGITYDSLYTFLQLLEGNLLRMEVQGINLSRPSTSGDETGSTIGLSTLTIQVYKQK